MSTPDNELPTTTIDPYKLAEQGAQLTGSMPVSALRRAGDLLASDEGSVQAILDFGRDDERRRIVRGELDARIWVVCQRCLEPMEEHVQSRFELAIVNDDEGARQIPGHYEPLETGPGGGIRVRELVEDELLLAMAPFPVHREEDCKADLAAFEQTPDEGDPGAAEDRKRPFDQLEGLFGKHPGDKDDSSRH